MIAPIPYLSSYCVWDGCHVLVISASGIATAGLTTADPMRGSIFAMEARGRAFAPELQHLKPSAIEMHCHVRKKSL